MAFAVRRRSSAQALPTEPIQQQRCLRAPALPVDSEGGHMLTNGLAVDGLGKHIGGIANARPLDEFKVPDRILS
eukprot:7051535-Alexandrium_andersonii.AAC.1